ncbi:hypothetical protein PLESTB_001960700 [Pleodorina starrii]|uniref:Wax synthase domain-containing protein n=1 Tax=Pleodorina starrii TaxID=330485 RepID=A0A9W6C3G5_9CHLO|nr:hypothetical protein PLESTB_001960700 [Pleodorina starrii]
MSEPSAAALGLPPFLHSAVELFAAVSSRFHLLPPLLRKALLLYAYAGLTALWAVALVRRLRPGAQRLIVTLPVLVGNLVAPMLLDPVSEPLLITPVAGLFSLAAFKVFTVGTSAAATAHTHTVKQGRTLLLQSWASTGVAMLVSWVLALPGLPVMVRHWLYTLASATFLTGMFDVLGAAAYLLLGITAAPTFDKPWLCDSFQDFWARRWNLTTTYMMRVLVYEPVIEGRLLPASVSRHRGGKEAAAPTVLSSSPGRQPSPQQHQPPTPPQLRERDVAAGAAPQEPQGNGKAPAGERVAAAAAVVAPPPAAPEESHGATTPDGEPSTGEHGSAPKAGGLAPAAEEEEGGGVEGTGLRRRRKPAESSGAGEQREGNGDAGGLGGRPASAAVAAAGGGARPPVSKLRRFLGLQAVFLFSGLWHILIFWYNTHVFSWRWCAFFAIQAPILMVERLVHQVGKKTSIRVPHFLQVFAANFLLIAVARPLFFGPTDTTGFAARNLAVGQAPMWALADITRRVATRF